MTIVRCGTILSYGGGPLCVLRKVGLLDEDAYSEPVRSDIFFGINRRSILNS